MAEKKPAAKKAAPKKATAAAKKAETAPKAAKTPVSKKVDSVAKKPEVKKPVIKEPEKVSDVAKLKTNVKLPDIKDILKAGVQFGHEKKRWNPRYEEYIFSTKNNIHIIDISKTLPLLEKAGNVLANAMMDGPVLMLGSKRQAAAIVSNAAQESGAHYIVNRWAGGFLTNFKQISASLKRLRDLEKLFEEGVTGRTKYEIAIMKKEWERLNRLYAGVKNMEKLPKAVFLVDPNYESGPVRECNTLGIPVVAIVDTNSDPSKIDYPIPANDDAIGSVELVVNYIAERLKELNSPFAVKHNLKDYSKLDVEIKKQVVDEEDDAELMMESHLEGKAKAAPVQARPAKAEKPVSKTASKSGKSASKGGSTGGGILSKYQERKEKDVKSRK